MTDTDARNAETKEFLISLRDLCGTYGYSAYFRIIGEEMLGYYNAKNKKNTDVTDARLHLANLILFLRKCAGKSITLYSTITKPFTGDIKNAPCKHEVISDYVIEIFDRCANAELADLLGSDYVDLGIPYRDQYEMYNYSEDVYTDDEILKIKEAETPKIAIHSVYNIRTKNSIKGEVVTRWYNEFVKAGIFTSKYHESGMPKGSSHEYNFLFHCYILLWPKVVLPDVSTSKEKFDTVKGWVKSYYSILDKRQKILNKLE